MIKLVRVVPT